MFQHGSKAGICRTSASCHAGRRLGAAPDGIAQFVQYALLGPIGVIPGGVALAAGGVHSRARQAHHPGGGAQDRTRSAALWRRHTPVVLQHRQRWEEGVGYLERETFDAFLQLPAPQRKLIREVILTFAKVHGAPANPDAAGGADAGNAIV